VSIESFQRETTSNLFILLFIFRAVSTTGNFGTVFVDQVYWHRATAHKTLSTGKSFIIAGLCWFIIPFFFGSTMGLSAVALEAHNGVALNPKIVNGKNDRSLFILTRTQTRAHTDRHCIWHS
jgi:hypothetical protein